MRKLHDLNSPYMTADEAAAYIRKGRSTFRAYVKRYNIPRHGPAGDRYLMSELESFMADSTCFLGLRALPPKRAASFTPVKV